MGDVNTYVPKPKIAEEEMKSEAGDCCGGACEAPPAEVSTPAAEKPAEEVLVTEKTEA